MRKARGRQSTDHERPYFHSCVLILIHGRTAFHFSANGSMKQGDKHLPLVSVSGRQESFYGGAGLWRDDFRHGINLARSGGGDIDEVDLSFWGFLKPMVCPLRGSFKSPVGHDSEIQIENLR